MTVIAIRRRRGASRGSRLSASCRRVCLHLEPLESRSLLSASALDGLTARPFSLTELASVTNRAPRGYSPAQVSHAYGFDSVAFNGGNIKGDGSGQTIAIVAAYDDPSIASDLQVFDRTFGLSGAPSFQKVNQQGGTSMPAASAAWSQEISLDVEWAHAMAPGASILLVEANTASLTDLLAAVNTARNAPGVSVVSMSWGTSEFSGQGAFDQYFTTPPGHAPVTFVASAGDSGAEATWPAISSNVIAVGGTALSASSAGYLGESAWSGSGGGASQIVSEPSYQRGVQSSGARTSPDVGYLASPSTGVAIYDSVSMSGRSGWFQVGGTSAGAPQWAALVAVVDQGRALSGQPLLGDGHAALYGLPSGDFHDVTIGSNGNSARAGYDLVTGRGTPVANAIARDLASGSISSAPSPAPAPAPKPTPAPDAGSVQYRYELVYINHRWYIVRVVSSAIDTSDDSGPSLDSVASGVSKVASSAGFASASNASVSESTVVGLLHSSSNPASATGPMTSPRRPGGPRGRATEPSDEEQPSESLAPDDGSADSAREDQRRAAEEASLETEDQSPTFGSDVRPSNGDESPCPATPLDPQSPARIDWRAFGTPDAGLALDPATDEASPRLINGPESDGLFGAMVDQASRQWESDVAMLAIGLAAAVRRAKQEAAPKASPRDPSARLSRTAARGKRPARRRSPPGKPTV